VDHRLAQIAALGMRRAKIRQPINQRLQTLGFVRIVDGGFIAGVVRGWAFSARPWRPTACAVMQALAVN
jgi:hypothetical protein